MAAQKPDSAGGWYSLTEAGGSTKGTGVVQMCPVPASVSLRTRSSPALEIRFTVKKEGISGG
jgi:hypothetical protein